TENIGMGVEAASQAAAGGSATRAVVRSILDKRGADQMEKVLKDGQWPKADRIQSIARRYGAEDEDEVETMEVSELKNAGKKSAAHEDHEGERRVVMVARKFNRRQYSSGSQRISHRFKPRPAHGSPRYDPPRYHNPRGGGSCFV